MSKSRQLIYVCMGLAGLSLTACASNQGPIMPQVTGERGAAVKAAMAKQIVDPTPVAGAPTLHPGKAAAALQRYLDDEIKEPTEAQEITIITGG